MDNWEPTVVNNGDRAETCGQLGLPITNLASESPLSHQSQLRVLPPSPPHEAGERQQ